MPEKKAITKVKSSRGIAYHLATQQSTTTYVVTRKLSTGTSVSFSKKTPRYVVEGKHLISYGK